MIFEMNGGRIAINTDRFDKIVTALRTAVDNNNRTLDKEATSYDVFRLAPKFYNLQTRRNPENRPSLHV
jgi:hypothetical protein